MKDLALISVSSMCAETVTHPMDFIKTQKQYYRTNISTFNIFKNVLKRDGFRGFYPSLGPAIIRHWIYTTTRVGLYEKLRSPDSDFISKFLSGTTAGGIAELFASPTDLVKVKLQTQQISNKTKKTPFQIIKNVYKTQGLKGFYHGWKPNVTRAMTVNIGELVAYDTGKNYLLN